MEAIINLRNQIKTLFDKDLTCKFLINEISNILEIREISIFFRSKEKGRYKLIASTTPKKRKSITKSKYLSTILSRNRLGISINKIIDKKVSFELKSFHTEVCFPIMYSTKLMGILCIGEKKNKEMLTEEERIALLSLCNEIASVIVGIEQYYKIQKQFLSTIQALVLAVEIKDPYLKGHSKKVARYAASIAKEIGLLPEIVELLKLSGSVHDVGKIVVSPKVYSKEGRLTLEEFNIVKKHVSAGVKLLNSISFPKKIIEIVSHHHERLDGEGYPSNLNAENLPLSSKILAVADAYAAITSRRPYREALNQEEAILELKKCSGKQLDSEIVDVLINVVKRK